MAMANLLSFYKLNWMFMMWFRIHGMALCLSCGSVFMGEIFCAVDPNLKASNHCLSAIAPFFSGFVVIGGIYS